MERLSSGWEHARTFSNLASSGAGSQIQDWGLMSHLLRLRGGTPLTTVTARASGDLGVSRVQWLRTLQAVVVAEAGGVYKLSCRGLCSGKC